MKKINLLGFPSLRASIHMIEKKQSMVYLSTELIKLAQVNKVFSLNTFLEALQSKPICQFSRVG